MVDGIQKFEKFESRGGGVGAINWHFIEVTNDFSYSHVSRPILLSYFQEDITLPRKKRTVGLRYQ